MRTLAHTYTCTPVHAHLYMHTCTCTPVHAHLYMHTCTCTPVHAHTLIMCYKHNTEINKEVSTKPRPLLHPPFHSETRTGD